jgi:hypothetical protein
MFVNVAPEKLPSTYRFRDPRNSFAEFPPISDFVRPFPAQDKCEICMPVASQYFLAALSRVKYIEPDLVHMTWCFGLVEHVKLVEIGLLTIGEWEITDPEIKVEFFDELQVL